MAEHPEEKEEDYNSASDDDFAPDALLADDAAESSSSDDDDETPAAVSVKKTKAHGTSKSTVEDLDFDNSGDEATIQKGKRKKRKLGNEEDEGGDGGLVKTRAQRRAEGNVKKPLQAANKSSLDVDALFAQMTSQKPALIPQPETTKNTSPPEVQSAPIPATLPDPNPAGTPGQADAREPNAPPVITTETQAPSTITIKRSYVFAGETQTEERTVPADSEEARLYLTQQASNATTTTTTARGMITSSKPPLRRPTKRKSMFAASGNDVDAAAAAAKGPKLNTLEKSKLDWAAQVDREGISDELSEARKAKGTYLGRLEFLGRMNMKREEELKDGAKGR